MKDNKKNYGFGLIGIILTIVISGIICSLTTGVILYNSYQKTNGLTYNELKTDESLQEFIKVYSNIVSDYYQDVDKEAMVTDAINAMFNYLGDDYSNYLSKEETDALASKLSGAYEGIGVSINTDKTILEVFDNSPAKEAGIQINDIVIKVASEDVTSLTSAEVVEKIKAAANPFDITVKRDNEEITVSLKRTALNIPSITNNIIEVNSKKIGYISIETFSATTGIQFADALKKMEETGFDSLIIDLRSNTGGYLSGAETIANIFLEKGKTIYSLENKDETKAYADTTDENKNYDIVILTNGGTASASEILTASLKESYTGNVTIIGTKTYGKGKVQQTMNLDNGSMAKYTTAKWLTPNGTCIDGVGINPDILIEYQLVKDESGAVVSDTQYEKALEALGS